MTSSSGTAAATADAERVETLRWRSWSLMRNRRWWWVVPTGVVGVGVVFGYSNGSWLLAIATAAGLMLILWQYFVPMEYEIVPLGLRRHALGRTWLIPWHAVGGYELRPTGIVFYQRGDPTKLDLMRSLFVPYPPDEDDLLCAIRQYLPHAEEIS